MAQIENQVLTALTQLQSATFADVASVLNVCPVSVQSALKRLLYKRKVMKVTCKRHGQRGRPQSIFCKAEFALMNVWGSVA